MKIVVGDEFHLGNNVMVRIVEERGIYVYHEVDEDDPSFNDPPRITNTQLERLHEIIGALLSVGAEEACEACDGPCTEEKEA